MNKKFIQEQWMGYKKQYVEKFGTEPKSWFSYLKWLAQTPGIGSFTSEEIEYTKTIMGI